VIDVGLIFIYKQPAQNIYAQGLAGKDSFLKAQDQLVNQQFEDAKESLEKAVSHFEIAQDEIKKLRWLKIVPWLDNQLAAVDNLLVAGINTGQSLQKMNNLTIKIITSFQKEEDISLANLSREETRQLLENIYLAKPVLEESKTSIDKAVEHINKIPQKGLLKNIKEATEPLKEKVPQLQKGIDQAISASQIIPFIAGYPDQKTYLFLLQNNTEMRPTGGFIGTYGILKVQDGDIKYFKTDNSYNLDKAAEGWLNVEPPWPLTRYNKVFKWFLRDSNWSPDFPTSAQKAEWFYHQEKGLEKNIDGVIAVTPTFIQSLLALTGEITVNGLTFNQDNLVDTLQYQVEQGFLRQGLAESERKEIIGVLSKKLLDNILALPTSNWPDLWQIFTQNVAQKHILIYIEDNNTQNFILKENWGGAIKDVNHDYLAIIDANLASLKSDPGVERTIEYTIQQDNNNFIADLKITYKNKGSITWKTTRYRTYTRVYVPYGSKLLKSEGAMVDCKLTEEGSVDTTEELNKTVFGTFICIEPDEEKSLFFKYKLPDNITTLFKRGSYHLLWQKQPGTANYPFSINIKLNKKMQSIQSIDKVSVNSNNEISIAADLSLDREITVNY